MISFILKYTKNTSSKPEGEKNNDGQKRMRGTQSNSQSLACGVNIHVDAYKS